MESICKNFFLLLKALCTIILRNKNFHFFFLINSLPYPKEPGCYSCFIIKLFSVRRNLIWWFCILSELQLCLFNLLLFFRFKSLQHVANFIKIKYYDKFENHLSGIALILQTRYTQKICDVCHFCRSALISNFFRD